MQIETTLGANPKQIHSYASLNSHAVVLAQEESLKIDSSGESNNSHEKM